MDEAPFYIEEPDGTASPVSFLEAHFVRRDILLYFDENVGEQTEPLIRTDVYRQDYWKFLSINYFPDNQWAESEKYRSLIEKGCLTLLSGIASDLLYEPTGTPFISKTWSDRTIHASTILEYVQAYRPSSGLLSDGQKLVIDALKFIEAVTPNDIDEDGCFVNFNNYHMTQWFDENVIQAYFRDMVNDHISRPDLGENDQSKMH
jgi:hypothetical protein